MATLCEPSQAPKYGLKYGPAHAKKDKPATGAGLRVYGGETGIRTLGGIAATIDFESIPFGHSGISAGPHIDFNPGREINVNLVADQTTGDKTAIRDPVRASDASQV